MKVINSVVLVSALLMGSLSAHADEPYPEGLPVPGKAQNESTSSHQPHPMMQACMEMMHKSDGERTPRSDS